MFQFIKNTGLTDTERAENNIGEIRIEFWS